MAIKKSIATGKSSQTATWSTSTKPAAGDDIIVEGGFSVEWNTTATRIRSIEVQSGCTLSGTSTIELGASSAGSNGVRENLLVYVSSGATITWKGSFNVSSTFTTTAQTITSGAKSLGTLKIVATNTAKIRLVEATTFPEGTTQVQGGTLELNGQTLTVTNFELAAGATLDATSSKLKITATRVQLSAGTLVGGSSCTLELEGETQAGEPHLLNGTTLAAIVATKTTTVSGVEVDPGASGCTVGELTINNKGSAAAKGFKITKEHRMTVTGALVTNGTEASKARIESSESGKAAKLKLTTEQESDGIALQDIALEGGPLYIAKGTNVSGNSEVGTTVFFEAKPVAGGPLTLGMMV